MPKQKFEYVIGKKERVIEKQTQSSNDACVEYGVWTENVLRTGFFLAGWCGVGAVVVVVVVDR